MTRKITQRAASAFFAGQNYHESNTEVNTYMGGLVELRLHGHTIALYGKYGDRYIQFTLAGYNTQTTRERLRGLGININTRRGKIFWDNCEIMPDKFYATQIRA